MQKYLNELEAMKIIKWRVPREEYLYTDATGRPRARPYTADPETGCVSIVECSEMNMGKTLQLYRLVLRQFTTQLYGARSAPSQVDGKIGALAL